MSGMNISPGETARLSYTKIDTAAGGNLAVAAGVAGKLIRIYRVLIVAAATGTIQFVDGATALTGVMTPATGAIFYLPFDGEPYFTGTAGATFNIALAAVQTSGGVWWTQQPLN